MNIVFTTPVGFVIDLLQKNGGEGSITMPDGKRIELKIVNGVDFKITNEEKKG